MHQEARLFRRTWATSCESRRGVRANGRGKEVASMCSDSDNNQVIRRGIISSNAQAHVDAPKHLSRKEKVKLKDNENGKPGLP